MASMLKEYIIVKHMRLDDFVEVLAMDMQYDGNE
jgi:hypothetical protein